MQRLNLTLETPAANLALDEALLDEAEAAEAADPNAEALRLWESPQPVVVLGRSSRVDVEVDAAECARRGIPILRRSSGGAAIIAGPGCLMYAVVLSYARRPEAHGIHQSHVYVLDRLVAALRPHAPTVARAGTSDLVLLPEGGRGSRRADWVQGRPSTMAQQELRPPITAQSLTAARKFSGNSLRVKRTHFLYHGTLLYDFDLPLVAACLRTPPRQPEYRLAREHRDFVANLLLARTTLEAALSAAWPTEGELVNWPQQRVAELVRKKGSELFS